jgi:hypothetical protein
MLNRRSWAWLAALSAVACTAGVTFGQAALASANPAIGTYSVADAGAGGAWQGGPMFADGSLGGGGMVEFPPPEGGQLVLRVTPLSWSYTDSTDSAVQLCFDLTELRPQPQAPFSVCAPPLPVTGGTGQMVDPGTGATAMIHVSFHG